ncbi:MAG: hypothetical protein DRJ03_01470 [Chloroflexi bacterium]|nr:MAG: hypothetical protein DRJ03_01470 [Chloroflexota bacterium]
MARKEGKKNRKLGRASRKPKTARYKARDQRFKNKLKRVRQSSGEAAAEQYALEHRRKRLGE